MGKGWIEDKGIYYSNNSYAREPYHWPQGKAWWEDDGYYMRPTLHSSGTIKAETAPASAHEQVWDDYKDAKGNYYFEDEFCPVSVDNDESYCDKCKSCTFCSTRAMNELVERSAQAAKERRKAMVAEAETAVANAAKAASM
jgi:hypothetical protein